MLYVIVKLKHKWLEVIYVNIERIQYSKNYLILFILSESTLTKKFISLKDIECMEINTYELE